MCLETKAKIKELIASAQSQNLELANQLSIGSNLQDWFLEYLKNEQRSMRSHIKEIEEELIGFHAQSLRFQDRESILEEHSKLLKESDSIRVKKSAYEVFLFNEFGFLPVDIGENLYSAEDIVSLIKNKK